MYSTLIRILSDQRGATTPTALLPLAAASGLGLLAAHGLHHHLSHLAHGLGVPDGLGGGLAESLDMGATKGKTTSLLLAALPALPGGKDEKIVTARNIARNPQILPGHRRVKAAKQAVTVQEPTGPTTYRNRETDQVVGCQLPGGGAVYIPQQPFGKLAELPFMPVDLAQAFQELPAEAQPVLAALCTLFLEQADDITRKYHEKHPGMTHGAVKFTLRQLAEQIGLSGAGKNLRALAEILGVMVFTHAKDFVVAQKRKVERKGRRKEEKAEELCMAIGRFITWIEYRWRPDKPFSEEATVGVTLCPALTDFLLSPGCRNQMVWVPVDALKKLRRKTRRCRYSVPLFFFLLAAYPGRGKTFRIGWEKASEKAGIPDQTESGRPIWPNEKRQLVTQIMQDINATGVLKIMEDENGVYSVSFPRTERRNKPEKELPVNTTTASS